MGIGPIVIVIWPAPAEYSHSTARMYQPPNKVQSSLALSVVVPCHNEQEGIGELYRRLSMACRSSIGDDHEIVFVDDGSRDDTWSKLAALSKADPHVVSVKLTRNYGHQLALTAGLDICRGARIFIIDADLQDPPELLGPMLKVMTVERMLSMGAE